MCWKSNGSKRFMHYSTKTTFGKIIWYLGDSNGGSFGTVGNMGIERSEGVYQCKCWVGE